MSSFLIGAVLASSQRAKKTSLASTQVQLVLHIGVPQVPKSIPLRFEVPGEQHQLQRSEVIVTLLPRRKTAEARVGPADPVAEFTGDELPRRRAVKPAGHQRKIPAFPALQRFEHRGMFRMDPAVRMSLPHPCHDVMQRHGYDEAVAMGLTLQFHDVFGDVQVAKIEHGIRKLHLGQQVFNPTFHVADGDKSGFGQIDVKGGREVIADVVVKVHIRIDVVIKRTDIFEVVVRKIENAGHTK